MNSTETVIHEKLAQLVKFAPIIKSLFAVDVTVTISDREKVVGQFASKDLNIGDMSNYRLTANDLMYKVMRDNRTQLMEIPKETYGVSMRTITSPITDDQGKVIGSIAVSNSLNNQENLVQASEQFAASSEEISASTSELSSSAGELMNYMNDLIAAQVDMNDQVYKTEKILELINSVAKSTRILGLNAGIEAARSGEHGRGFSIVAKEITKLADKSAESVNEIHQLLNVLKEKVEHVAQTVNQTVDVSKNQSTSITEISEAIQHLSVVAEDIEELARKV